MLEKEDFIYFFEKQEDFIYVFIKLLLWLASCDPRCLHSKLKLMNKNRIFF